MVVEPVSWTRTWVFGCRRSITGGAAEEPGDAMDGETMPPLTTTSATWSASRSARSSGSPTFSTASEHDDLLDAAVASRSDVSLDAPIWSSSDIDLAGTSCCWTTCVSSCAMSLRSAADVGESCPAPNTTSRPTVYASAVTTRADSAAFASACTRTWLKSWPKRGSMNERVAASSGWPRDASTSCTMGGTIPVHAGFAGVRCTVPWRVAVHSSHPPLLEVWLPQAHVRCTRRVFAGVENCLCTDPLGVGIVRHQTSERADLHEHTHRRRHRR